MSMDGQTATHGSKYAYASSYWPECYDLWIDHLFGQAGHEDTTIFADTALCSPEASGGMFNVLDIGTGTGRIVKDLLSGVLGDRPDRRLSIMGIDNSGSMLGRAQMTFDRDFRNTGELPSGCEVAWIKAPAAEMVTRLPGLAGNVDLAIFAAGGIAHLTADHEIEAFLDQLALALRPEQGRAIISVLHETMASPNAQAQQRTKQKEHEQDLGEPPILLPSREHDGLVFVKHATKETWCGDVRTDSFVLEVRDSDGNTLESTEVEWSLRLIDESRLLESLAKDGLAVEGRTKGSIQDWFLLRSDNRCDSITRE